MKFDAVNGMLSMNSSALKDPSVVSKVAIGFDDDAIACIRLLKQKLLLLLLVLLRVLREEEETTFLITRRSDDDDIFEVFEKKFGFQKAFCLILAAKNALLVFFYLVVCAILRRDNVYNMWYHYALKSSY